MFPLEIPLRGLIVLFECLKLYILKTFNKVIIIIVKPHRIVSRIIHNL